MQIPIAVSINPEAKTPALKAKADWRLVLVSPNRLRLQFVQCESSDSTIEIITPEVNIARRVPASDYACKIEQLAGSSYIYYSSKRALVRDAFTYLAKFSLELIIKLLVAFFDNLGSNVWWNFLVVS